MASDDPPAEPLEPGGFVRGKAPFELGEVRDVGTDLLADVQSISRSLDVITARLVAGEGLFGRLLKDREFGDRTLTDLEAIVRGVREIVVKSSEGENLLGRLVADEELAQRVMDDLETAVRDLEAITGRIEAGEGPLGRLTAEDSDVDQALDDFVATAAAMRRLAERVESAEGSFAHRLLFDEELGGRLAASLEETLSRSASVARKIDGGDGTVGMLVNDQGVYHGLDDIVSGIESSWFLGYVLKRKQKKGYRERVDSILARSEDPDAELLSLMIEVLDVDAATAATVLEQRQSRDAAPSETAP